MAYRRGAPIRLRDVAQVSEGMLDVRNAGLANSKPAVIIGILRQPGANMIETANRVKALVPELRASIPPRSRWKALRIRRLQSGCVRQEGILNSLCF